MKVKKDTVIELIIILGGGVAIVGFCLVWIIVVLELINFILGG